MYRLLKFVEMVIVNNFLPVDNMNFPFNYIHYKIPVLTDWPQIKSRYTIMVMIGSLIKLFLNERNM